MAPRKPASLGHWRRRCGGWRLAPPRGIARATRSLRIRRRSADVGARLFGQSACWLVPLGRWPERGILCRSNPCGTRDGKPFRASGSAVLVGRAGDLRNLLWALGVGTEVGLGRLLRFSVPDFRKSSRGPGPTGGPRVELPSLCCSLPYEKACRLIEAGLVPEANCDCPACSRSSTPLGSASEVAEHDAHVVLSGAAELAGLDVATRIAALDSKLERAIREWRSIDLAGLELGRPRRLERQREVLALAVDRGIHNPAHLLADLRLVE